MYLKDGGEEMVLSDEANDDTRHSCRFFYSNVATTQVSKCKGYACARFWRQPRPAPGARPARVRFDIPIEARLEIRKYSDRS